MQIRVPDFLPLAVLLMWTCTVGLAADKPLLQVMMIQNKQRP